MMTIYAGNLPFSTNEKDVVSLFEKYGTVHSITLITDPETGRLKGFGFIQMDDDSANRAITDLNDNDFGGRTLKVHRAKIQGKPQRQRKPMPDLKQH